VKYIILSILVLFSLSAYSQIEDTPLFVGKYFGNQSGGGSGYWQVTGNFTDESGYYDATSIQVGDVLFFVDAGIGYHLPVTSIISASGSSFTIRVNNTGISGVAGVPNGPGGIYRANSPKGIWPFTAGLTASDQQTLNSFLIKRLNNEPVKRDTFITVPHSTNYIPNLVITTPSRFYNNIYISCKGISDTSTVAFLAAPTSDHYGVVYNVKNDSGLVETRVLSDAHLSNVKTSYLLRRGQTAQVRALKDQAQSGAYKWAVNLLWDSTVVSGGGSGITALTGDVTASGTGSVAATIANNAVTSAKVASQTLDSTDFKNRGTTLLKLAQSGATNGQIPKYNSTTGNWEPAADAGGSATPGGSTTNVQYNNTGAFAGDAKMSFNPTTKTFTVSKIEVTDTTDNGTPAAAIRINRSLVTGAIFANGHGFRDQTIFSRPIYSYASFDGALTINATGNNDHSVSFQSRISAATTGTIGTLWAGVDNNSIDGSRVTNLTSWESAPAYTSGIGADFRRGFRVKDITGTASTGSQYGMYIDSLGNATSNYGIYIAATKTGGYAVYSPGRVTANYYAGKTSIGSIFNTGAMAASLTVDNVLNNAIHALVVSVEASANQRKSIIFRQDGRSNLSFSDFSGNFQPSLQLQSDDNAKMLWIAPSGGTGGNALLYAGATGFEITTGSSVTSGGTSRFQITNAGRASFGVGTPTAVLHLKAGTATANTAPLKFTSGTNLTTGEAGAIEYDGTDFYATNSTASRTILARVLKGSGTLDFPDTASGASSSLTITVTGAATTDSGVSVQRDNASISGTMYEWVITGANTVTVYFHNFSGSNQNPASGTFRATVTK